VIRLDPALVERLMHETRQVASLLDEAMPEGSTEEEEGAKAPPPAAPGPAADPRFEGLADRYRAVLAALCTRPSWTRADFDALVREHSLMPSGTLDAINEWSQDRFDDPIVEDEGDELIVRVGLVEEPA
jgi:hypothetical protein